MTKEEVFIIVLRFPKLVPLRPPGLKEEIMVYGPQRIGFNLILIWVN